MNPIKCIVFGFYFFICIMALVNGKRKDLGWKYNYLANVEDTNLVTCFFCNKVKKGGIHKVKKHQVGNFKTLQSI